LFNFWNLLDWFILSLFLVCISQRYTWYQQGLQQTVFSADTFTDIHGVAFLAKMEVNLSSLNAFAIYFKTFKYLDMVPGMDQLFLTLGFCAKELFIFLIMFFIVYIGFGMAFHLAFGLMVPEYRTVGTSLISLLRVILGDFDFDALMNANRPMAFILISSYIILVFFILMNMLLAIIGDAYSEVKSQQEGKLELPNFMDKLRALYQVLKGNYNAAKEIKSELASALADDGVVDKRELQAILDHHAVDIVRLGLAKDARALMRRFDTDGSGTLDRSELNNMVAAINAGITNSTSVGMAEAITEQMHNKEEMHRPEALLHHVPFLHHEERVPALAHLDEHHENHLPGIVLAAAGAAQVVASRKARRFVNTGNWRRHHKVNLDDPQSEAKLLAMAQQMASEREEEEALRAAEAASNAAKQLRRSPFELYRDCAATNIGRVGRAHVVRQARRRDEAAYAAKYRDENRGVTIGRRYLNSLSGAVRHFEPIGWHKKAFTDDALRGVPGCVVRAVTRLQTRWRGVKTRKDLRLGLSHLYGDPCHREKTASTLFRKTGSGAVVMTNFARLPEVKQVVRASSYPPVKVASILEKTVWMMDRLNTLTAYLVEDNRDECVTASLNRMMDLMDDVACSVLHNTAQNAAVPDGKTEARAAPSSRARGAETRNSGGP
jgi:hypothetical protein